MPRIELKVIWTDDDDMLQLVVSASNGLTSSSMEVYAYPAEVEAFASGLEAFPRTARDEVVWESGSADPKWYGHMRLRAYVLDGSGHSALEVLMDVRGDPSDCTLSNFSLRGNPADFNELGRRINSWLAEPSAQFVGEWRNV